MRKFTRKQIVEAIRYWERKMAEADGEKPARDDTLVDDKSKKPADGEKPAGDKPAGDKPAGDKSAGDKPAEGKPADAPVQAAKKPIGVLNIFGRFYRIHVNAVKRAVKAAAKFLNSKGAKVSEDDIHFENSYVDEAAGRFQIDDSSPMVITMQVAVDKVQLKGWKKFMAKLLEESVAGKRYPYRRIDEWGDKKLEKANEELKKQLGVAGLQEYVKRFCGPFLAKKINYEVVKDNGGQEVKEEGQETVYKYSVAFKVVSK